ncbi:solute carrier family 22 member 15-like [Octopus sinensis]|uniref:Solute carrier family 22 member 15-like n=1 Tax=Octopus sinensis TaxID=2607531 RepID=A0A6P7T1Y8_9MOLL|nr:solute carrier family 22 member 15-like [Octopus sinensis]
MENNLMELNDVNGKTISEFKVSSNSEITEEILKKCGGYGLFQKICTAFVLTFLILDALSYLTVVFIREEVAFACYPANFNESMIPSNISLDEFLSDVTVKEEKCSVYNLDTEEGFYVLPTSNSTKEPCNYGRKFFPKDVTYMVSDYDLVCDREWLKNIAAPAMFGGVLVGALTVAPFSDKFGRFKIYIFGEIFYLLCRAVKLNSPNYVMLIVMYFLEGLAQSFSFLVTYTILIECVSQDYRMPLNFISHGAFAIGEILLAGVAYLIRDWKHLQYATCLPRVVLVVVAFKYLPESPRWLLNKKRFAKAKRAFEKMARTNKKDSRGAINLIRMLQAEAESNPGTNRKFRDKTYTALHLLKIPRRAMISINLWFCWFVNSMLYYGVTLNSVDMSGNKYLNFLMISVIEIPSGILGVVLYHYFGHRKPLFFLMVFGGINCIVSNFVPTGNFWYPLILTVLGKLGATASFSGVYLTSAELFPTVVRNIGLGTSSSFARVGSLVSPLILGLTVYGSWIPLTVYGILGIFSGFLILLLPEMKESSLLQTFEEMDKL